MRQGLQVAAAAALVLAGYAAGRTAAPAHAQGANRVFELRTYTTPDAEKFDMLNERFRKHTTRLFERHGMKNVGYWTAVDRPNTLIYLVSHESLEQAKKNWAAFRSDPDWQKVSKETQAAGLTGVKIESTFLQPTDYSAIK